MRKKYEELEKYLINKGFGRINPEIVLHAISLIVKGYCRKVYSLQLTKEDICDNWDDIEKLNGLLSKVVEETELDNGSVFWPVRVALSSRERSASPTELLWFHGKDTSIQRLELALKKLK